MLSDCEIYDLAGFLNVFVVESVSDGEEEYSIGIYEMILKLFIWILHRNAFDFMKCVKYLE